MNYFIIAAISIIACVGFFLAGFSFAVYLINRTVRGE